jgi:hypothetical protein
MNESLLRLKTEKYDGINFYLNDDGDVTVDVFTYKNPPEYVGGSEMGDLYDIIIFPEDPPKMPERFKAILSSPPHYVDRMIQDGFLGVIAKVTTTSDKFMDETLQYTNDMVANYIKIYEDENDE